MDNKIEELLEHINQNYEQLCNDAENSKTVVDSYDDEYSDSYQNTEEYVDEFTEDVISEMLDEMIEDGLIKKNADNTYSLSSISVMDELSDVLNEMLDNDLIEKIRVNGQDKFIIKKI